MKTTLNKIKEHSPCEDGWKKLLSSLNKTEADDEELSLLTILESNGLNDALWALQTVDGFEKEIRLMACDFAQRVVHLMKDARSVTAIKVARNYANGLATIEELNAARAAAWAAATAAAWAARAAAWAAAGDAVRAAAWAADAARFAWAADAARFAWAADAARDAAWVVCFEREKQIAIFKKYVK